MHNPVLGELVARSTLRDVLHRTVTEDRGLYERERRCAIQWLALIFMWFARVRRKDLALLEMDTPTVAHKASMVLAG